MLFEKVKKERKKREDMLAEQQGQTAPLRDKLKRAMDSLRRLEQQMREQVGVQSTLSIIQASMHIQRGG